MAYSGTGSGTAQDPYIITDVDQLNEIRNHNSSHWELGNDIDASDTVNWNGGEGWVRIGSYTNPFEAHLNGKGFAINNLFANRLTGGGLFGGLVNSSVVDLFMNNADITGGSASIFLGSCLSSNISNVHVQGTVIYNEEFSGGFIGFITGSEVTDCSANVNIIPTGVTKNFIGVLIGEGYTFSVKRSKASGYIRGNNYCGGVVGSIDGEVLVEDCYNESEVDCTGVSGGVVGSSYAASSSEVNEIKNCYNTGLITSGTGAVLGAEYVFPTTNSNNYYDSDLSETTQSAIGEMKTSTEMKTLSTYIPEWDIVDESVYVDETWFIYDGVDYPRLGWEITPEQTNSAGFTLLTTHEQGDTTLHKVGFSGFTLLETHIDKVEEIEFAALTLREYVPQPDYPSLLFPNYISNIRVYRNNLKGQQLNIENKINNKIKNI